MYMDEEGPSTSYRGRGYSRGGQYNRGRGRGTSYDQDNRFYQAGRSSGRFSEHNGYRDDFRGRSSSRGQSTWGNTQAYNGSSRGRGRGRGRGYQDPDDVKYQTLLRGHAGSVTALIFDEGSGQLFSGSKDSTVKVWDHLNSKEVKSVPVGGEVYSMLYSGSFLFVGTLQASEFGAQTPAAIKVYNIKAGSEDTLEGHKGPVYSLAAGGDMLFSAGQDCTIKVWKFSAGTGKFMPHVELTAAQGGHASPISKLLVHNGFLFSADWKGKIKVWDFNSGQCVQTVEKAHEDIVMSLLAYQSNILSGSVDGSIRVWVLNENPSPGAVLSPQPAYVHPPPGANVSWGHILALEGSIAPDNQHILLSSCSNENTIKLWQLPDFGERGHLNAIRNCRSIVCGQGYIFAGDYESGCIKVWKWNA